MSRICIIGLDYEEYSAIEHHLDAKVVAHEMLPKIIVRDGILFVSSPNSIAYLPISRVVFHGIFEDDHDLISALALWGGPCLPNAHAMMDCRLKLPCLVRALQFTQFGQPQRGFASADAEFDSEIERVAKWGNWHCGENKLRFANRWTADQSSIIEPFLEGQAVRIVVIGERYWQIKLDGDSWLKSIHHDGARLMDVDDVLLHDTRAVAAGFGLEVIANDYIVSSDGVPHLLEVNHIPNVTRFPEIWNAYVDFVVAWAT